jgi:hypothetical protein
MDLRASLDQTVEPMGELQEASRHTHAAVHPRVTDPGAHRLQQPVEQIEPAELRLQQMAVQIEQAGPCRLVPEATAVRVQSPHKQAVDRRQEATQARRRQTAARSRLYQANPINLFAGV